ncbi:hypothetical protein [Streptomyces sp. x-80]|uniref:hypothetical protein n=1 Tax=Streptomyces sp. x-80 TaxID=2789282 RepID=UPI00397FB173
MRRAPGSPAGHRRALPRATNFITSRLPAGPAVGSAETLIHALREEIDGTLAASQLTG